jgi:hypothetical protein
VFPSRDEFVGVGEHGAWPNEVKNLAKDLGGKPLDFAGFATIEVGVYDGRKAQLAWGFFHFLRTKLPAKISPLLEELRQYRDLDNRGFAPDGTWVRDEHYQVPVEKQLEIVKKHTGPEVLKGAALFLRKLGDEPKPKDEEKSALK